MKVAVSIPDDVFARADELAERLGVSRSELYRRALDSLLEATRAQTITERLDEVYAENAGSTPALERVQAEIYEQDDEW